MLCFVFGPLSIRLKVARPAFTPRVPNAMHPIPVQRAQPDAALTIVVGIIQLLMLALLACLNTDNGSVGEMNKRLSCTY